jgi:methylenetetrahydrofolate dehydrogenase (NADP+) / methenyltetrahydrofolate cyclohydrolase
MKYLNGSELVDFIKERQARQARFFRQSRGINPKLTIINCGEDAPSLKYTSLKQAYGEAVDVAVDIVHIAQEDILTKIVELNGDDSVQGVIVQLPLPEPAQTDEIVNQINPEKDVDGLGCYSHFDPATPTAILWLLAGYNIEMREKNVVIVGQGRLVGAPLVKMLKKSGLEPVVVDLATKDAEACIVKADILITATGQPGLIKPSMIKKGAVVIDAGVAGDKGVLRGDVDDEVYLRDDLKITPKIGGVGPLTIAVLFDNILKACSKQASSIQKTEISK